MANYTDALTPGGAPGNLQSDVTNGNAVGVQVSSIVLSVASTSAGASCAPSNFTVTQGVYGISGPNTAVSFPYALAAGGILDDSANSGGSMAKLYLIAAAPPACEAVTVNLSVVVS